MSLVTFLGRGGKTITVDTDAMRLQHMKYRVMTWARCVNDLAAARKLNAQKTRVIGLTLTYDTQGTLVPAAQYEPRHITDYLKKLRDKAGDKLLAYAWVLELQKNGTPHYHVCLVIDPSFRVPMPDVSGMWAYGMSKVQTRSKSGRLLKASSKYLMKYATKGSDERGTLPKGAHVFAVVIRCELPDVNRFFFRISAAVGVVRRLCLAWYNALKLRGGEGTKWFFDEWKWSSMPGGGWWVTHGKWEGYVQSEWEMVSLGEYKSQTAYVGLI